MALHNEGEEGRARGALEPSPVTVAKATYILAFTFYSLTFDGPFASSIAAVLAIH